MKRRHNKSTYRSGLEDTIAAQLDSASLKYEYETVQLNYTIPAKERKYTPDFILVKPNGTDMIIETKGIFDLADRQKVEQVLKEYPGIDFRMVFSNANAKLYKGSKTTYANWCDKHDIPWAHKVIPKTWLEEVSDK